MAHGEDMTAETSHAGQAHLQGFKPGILRATLPGVVFALLGTCGTVAASALMAIYTGSYLPWSVIAMVTAFWSLIAAGGTLVAAGVATPLFIFVRGRARLAIMPAVVVAGCFFANAFVTRDTITDNDCVGKTVLLNTYFIASWAALLGVIAGLLTVKSEHMSDWGVTAVMVLSICASAGAAYFMWKPGGAFTLVMGPLALPALVIAALDRVGRATLRAAGAGAVAVLYAAALLVAADIAGEKPLAPIDNAFRADAGKIALIGDRPNVIIITLDTVRADHTGLCGYKYRTTPELEKLAADCQLFRHGESVDSWTLPAHASLFTGLYPREHGAHADSKISVETIEKYRPYGAPLSAKKATLATLLSLRGYNTGGIVSNYSWLCRQYGVDQGFQYYYDLPRMLIFTPGGAPIFVDGMEAIDRALGYNGKLVQPYWSARAVTRRAESWIDRNSQTPFFLFLNYMDPHYPYSAVPPFDSIDGPGIPYDMMLRQVPWQDLISKYISTGKGLTPELLRTATNQYDGEIAYSDHWVGELVAYLKGAGLYDNTLIVVTSDHGEFFGEHQLLNHGVGIYEGGLRIPILVKYPGQEHKGEVRDERVSIMDIFATVFEVLKFPMPPGVSAVPLGAPTRRVFAEDFENGMNVKRYGDRFKGNRTAVFAEDWKYLQSTTAPGELYDLGKDSEEKENAAKFRTDVAADLVAFIARWQTEKPPFDGSQETNKKPSAADLERLHSLGYL